METTRNICFLILSFQHICFVLSKKDKRLLLTDPDFKDQQQILQDIHFSKATFETLKQGSTVQITLIQKQATEIPNFRLKLLQREKDQSALETELRKTKSDIESLLQNKLSCKLNCTSGWNLEYYDTLTTGYLNHKGASTYICVDLNPEVLEGGSESRDGYVLYPVVAVCG